MDNLKFIVPAGLGDISWVWSKLSTLNMPIELYVSADGIRRSHQLFGLLPNLALVEYINLNFHQIRDTSVPYNISKKTLVDLSLKQKTPIFINTHLEHSRRIESFLPDIETDLHYTINTDDNDKKFAQDIVTKKQTSIAIYCSSYNNIFSWSGWVINDWKKFISLMTLEIQNISWLILGADYDNEFATHLCQNLKTMQILNLAGKTTLSQTIEILKHVNYLVSFPSGIAIIANVVRCPVFMFYPTHLKHLIQSWPDQNSIKDNTYKGCLFCPPEQAADWILNTYTKKRISERRTT